MRIPRCEVAVIRGSYCLSSPGINMDASWQSRDAIGAAPEILLKAIETADQNIRRFNNRGQVLNSASFGQRNIMHGLFRTDGEEAKFSN